MTTGFVGAPTGTNDYYVKLAVANGAFATAAPASLVVTASGARADEDLEVLHRVLYTEADAVRAQHHVLPRAPYGLAPECTGARRTRAGSARSLQRQAFQQPYGRFR